MGGIRRRPGLPGPGLLTTTTTRIVGEAHEGGKKGVKVGAEGLEPPNLTDVNRAL